jgi:hypothetical protein
MAFGCCQLDRTGGPVTPEMVKRLMEELDELDMLRAMNPNADLPR